MLCSIANFSDIVKVEYFEPSVVNFTKPYIVYDPIVNIFDNSANATDAINAPVVDGKYATILNRPAFIAHIDEMSGQLGVEESMSVAGTKFHCTLTYNMEWQNKADCVVDFESQLTELQKSNYHVRITYLGGEQHFLRTDIDGWMFTYKEQDGKVSVTLMVDNVSGAQRVSTLVSE